MALKLIPTIRDCLATARYPDALRFGICWQHGTDEQPFAEGDPRFRVLDVDWRASRGACWARAAIMRLWDGEDFYFQLDSHHRFAPLWDLKLLQHAERAGSRKPILSGHPPAFTPDVDSARGPDPIQMVFERYDDDGIAVTRSQPIPDWRSLHRPVRARFLSANFLFTIGAFVTEVPYDPDLYFVGEEFTLTIRAFTHGYDLFHVPDLVLWHEYVRSACRRHWDDHLTSQSVERTWYERDAISKQRVKYFLESRDLGMFGCGPARSFADYEAYAGLSLNRRKAQDYTRFGYEPPNPPAPLNWIDEIRSRRARITLDRARLPTDAWRDAQFWYVAIHDATGRELHRQDVSAHDVRALLASRDDPIVLDRAFESGVDPVSWTVWPVSQSGAWLTPVRGAVSTRRESVAQRRKRLRSENGFENWSGS